MPNEERVQPAGNPLHKKLGLRPGSRGLVIAAPEGDGNPLSPLPEGIASVATPQELGSLTGDFDYIHFFAGGRGELAQALPSLQPLLAAGGSLWISWIKQSSSRRGAGIPGDLNENTIRPLALMSGFVDVKVASLDEEWSALKLVRRKLK